MAQRLETYRRPREQPWMDVWTRTAPKYRRRAVLLLIVTAALFAGLCVFAFWLRTGAYTPWEASNYGELMRKSFNPTGPNQVTLVDFLLFPISVEEVPVQIVIMGLLLATLASVPILVGILYRFPASLIFCAMIAGLAAMPWFAATIALGCYLASGRPLRMEFRYASAILGLVPIVVYFVMATRQPRSVYSPVTPYGFKLYLPWVLAVLGSCAICGIGLGLARLINYRPGGIAPVLAVLFAIPVVLFHAQVGRDELEYRLLEHRYGPSSRTAFRNRDLRQEATKQAERLWKRSKSRPFAEILEECVGKLANDAYNDLAIDRLAAVAGCEEFKEYFRESRYVPCVLYIEGRALDERINPTTLVESDRVEHTSDLPSNQSRVVWQTLATKYPREAPAAVALNRLATLALQEGNITEADTLLRTLVERFDPQGSASQPAASVDATVVRPRATAAARRAAWSTLGIDLDAEIQRARREREIIATCRDELPTPFDASGIRLTQDLRMMVHPLAALASLDPHHPKYAENLRAIAAAYPWSGVQPIVAAQLAILEPSPGQQIERLELAEKTYKGMPGCAEVLMRHAEALKEASRFRDAAKVYTRLTEAYPLSCWAGEAHERLVVLSMLSSPG